MPVQPLLTGGGPDVLPNPISEPDSLPPNLTQRQTSHEFQPLPEPALTLCGTIFPYVRREVSVFKKNLMIFKRRFLIPQSEPYGGHALFRESRVLVLGIAEERRFSESRKTRRMHSASSKLSSSSNLSMDV